MKDNKKSSLPHFGSIWPFYEKIWNLFLLKFLTLHFGDLNQQQTTFSPKKFSALKLGEIFFENKTRCEEISELNSFKYTWKIIKNRFYHISDRFGHFMTKFGIFVEIFDALFLTLKGWCELRINIYDISIILSGDIISDIASWSLFIFVRPQLFFKTILPFHD